MTGPEPLLGVVDRLLAAARARGHRRLLVLAGTAVWGRAEARRVLQRCGADEHHLWVGEGEGARAAAEVWQELGREYPALVFDAHCGFDPDAFGAVAGTVHGGGLLLLLTPPLADWHRAPDPERVRLAVHPLRPEQVPGRYLWRLARLLRDSPDAWVVEQDGTAVPAAPDRLPPSQSASAVVGPAGGGPLTPDQAQAVEALVRSASGRGHRRRPVVLTSDRGRGKSSALGLAAARLLRQGLADIRVTAPAAEAVQPLLEHAAAGLPGSRRTRTAVEWRGRSLRFAVPRALLDSSDTPDLVLVDEAAAIPTPVLAALLRRHPRMAFATTVHGYEGTGRGFALRFNALLDRETRGWQAVRLQTPVRWSPGDPVEALVFRLLLLDAEPGEVPPTASGAPRWEWLVRDRLAADEPLLTQVFGLLVQAHYRTRPLDLRHLLDGPNVRVGALWLDGRLVGTLMVAEEGGFDAAFAEAVWRGRARPMGHMLPETLAAHCGLRQAPERRGLRVVRIAVHPDARRRGLGRRLLLEALADARRRGLDYLGTAFGTTDELLRFWQCEGLAPVRVSLRRGAASGAHSVVMLRAVSAAGESLLGRARARFLDGLPHLLADPLRRLEPALADQLLRAPDQGAAPPVADDWEDLRAFAASERIFEACLPALRRWTLWLLADPERAARLTPAERHALILRLLQHRDWSETARVLSLPGRRQVTGLLREAVAGQLPKPLG
ncbi:tRNA(Met) cytidine acetyltransferase TmcA [Alkalilimnicola ehrlichii]|uniref:tRNA(Met) cytidine acetyltransferase TmcA n=1 Tax=Alkalilimnicola ehrlichii TaxID=351052 RepID=UPI003BA236AE